MCNLSRTTGNAIATAILESLNKHSIDVGNCLGQSYDTTSSMSSNNKGVHAQISKVAPDANYQGCCLHSLNPRVCQRQTNRDNVPANTVEEYWKRAVAIPFLDIITEELKSRFSEDKRAHYELCSLVPELIRQKDQKEVAELSSTLKEKWGHVLPIATAFDSEIFRWCNYWKRREMKEDQPITTVIVQHADQIFFPNVRELLKILAVLPIGSVEAERSFSCLRRIHTWLRTTMTTARLSDLAVIAMHGNVVPLTTQEICQAFMKLHPRRMKEPSLFC
jgi:hypothetical protein